MAHLTTRQIKQLIEIDNAGFGIRADVSELIRRLTSGGVGIKSDDPRVVQAKFLWDKGWGRELGFDSFDAYLATVPEVPEDLRADDERFPLLVLVDARLGLVKIYELLGVEYDGGDQIFEDFDPTKAKTEKVYWIRAQDGRQNNGKSVGSCRNQFADASDEVGLTAYEGLALFAQNPKGLKGRAMNLPGSVNRGNRANSACLNWLSVRPRLEWNWYGHGDPRCSCGSRRE